MSNKIEREKLRELRGAEIYEKFTKTREKRWPIYQAQYKKLLDQGVAVPVRFIKKYKLDSVL